MALQICWTVYLYMTFKYAGLYIFFADKPDNVELLSNSTEDSYCSDLWVNFTCKVSGANPAISKYVLFEHSEFVASNNKGTWIQKLSEGKIYVYHCMTEHIVKNVNSTDIVTITVNGELADIFLLVV